jgi:hypothetical protein
MLKQMIPTVATYGDYSNKQISYAEPNYKRNHFLPPFSRLQIYKPFNTQVIFLSMNENPENRDFFTLSAG